MFKQIRLEYVDWWNFLLGINAWKLEISDSTIIAEVQISQHWIREKCNRVLVATAALSELCSVSQG